MFALSLYLINKTKLCKVSQTIMYSVALGLILYSSIYVYLLFYNESYLSVFNNFVLYILLTDLSISIFYYYKLQQSNIIHLMNNEDDDISDNDSDETISSVDLDSIKEDQDQSKVEVSKEIEEDVKITEVETLSEIANNADIEDGEILQETHSLKHLI